MKRSLFIAIVVLLMAALFVSCNAEKSLEDQLVEVTINGGARALDVSAESVSVNPEGLVWYYTAEKKDSFFTTGQTLEKKALKADAASGLAGSLGEFSRGAWEFKFYGYDKVMTDTTAKLVYSAETTATVGRTQLDLTLTLKAESVGKSDIYVDGVTFDCAQLALDDYTGAKLVIKVAGTTEDPVINGVLEQGTRVFSFSSATPVFSSVDAGTYAVVFEVYGLFDTDQEEKIGEYPTSVTVIDGMKYTISDNITNPRIDAVDPTTAVIIAGADLPATKIQKDTQPLASTAVTFETSNTPKAADSAKTTVVFEENSFTQTGNAELTVTTYNAGAAEAQFQIQGSDNKAIAGLSLSLASGETTISSFNQQYATVSTYIGTGLVNPTVVYSGTGEQPRNITYDASTGYITFETSHFSSFFVFEAEAKIGTKLYATVKDAVDAAQAGDTVELLKNASYGDNNTVKISVSKNLVLNLNGNTLTSRFTVFGGTVEVKNGTIVGRVDAYNDTLTIAADATIEGALIVWGDSSVQEAPTANIYGTINGFIQMSYLAQDSYNEIVNIYDGATINGSGVWAYNGGVVNFYGGIITSPDTVGIALFDEATLTMSAGTINAHSFGVSNNGNGTNQTITVSGGTITSETAAAIYHAGLGTTTISGATTLTGTTGIEIRAGVLNISGTPVITGTATETSVEANGNGSTTEGAGIAVAQHTTKHDIAVTITGGTISGIYAVSIENPENNAEGEGNLSVSISGATLNSAGNLLQILKNDDRVNLSADGYTVGVTTTGSGGGAAMVEEEEEN